MSSSVVRLLLLALVVGAVTSCVPPPEGGVKAPSTLDQILRRGELRVGLEAGYFPFEMKDRSGDFIGFDVEMAGKMAEKLGVKLTIKNTDWDGIIPSLVTGKFDIIMSGMTRTPKRALMVNFANPYFKTGQILLVNRSMGDTIKSYRDLQQEGRTIAVKLGTTGDIAATRLFKKATIRRFQTEVDAATEVNFGRADAFVYDEPFIRIWAKRYEDKVRAITPPFTTEHLAWAVRKGDQDFLNWLNVFLESVRNDDPVESTYDRLYRKYFVEMPWRGQVEESGG